MLYKILEMRGYYVLITKLITWKGLKGFDDGRNTIVSFNRVGVDFSAKKNATSL